MKSIASKLLISIGIATILFFIFLFYQTYSLVSGREKEIVEQQASMALKFDVAIRDYIAQHVRPVMYKMVGKDGFMPETMSTSFVARTIFEDVRKEFPDYIIKFSSDNPRNPSNKAGSEELKIIDYFNDNPQSQRWEGKISINDKPYFAKFRAMRMQAACLGCHGDPENAPASLLKRYGSTAGFHRPLGKVIGMDTIAIPIVKITEHLWPKSMQAFFLIALGLLLFFLSIIYLTRFIVTKRLSSITEHFLTAAQQSNYQEITPIEIEGNDEIRDLAVSFNSLCDRLKNFYSSLETKIKDRTQELSDKNEQMKQEIEERKRAEEALKASETFLKTLINAIPFPVFYKDKNGRYLGFNRAFEAFSGKSRKRLIGKTVFDINPPELAETYHAKDSELFECGGVQQYESQAENAHGVMRDVIFNKALFFDSQKSVSGLIGIIIDITERKQAVQDLRKSELKYKTLIDNINSGVAVYEAKNDGEDFFFVDINKAGEKIENIRKEDLIGKSVLDVFPSIKDFGLLDVFKKVWKTGKPEYFPIALYKDERISGWRENYVYRLFSGEIIAVYHDKTEQKKSEDALRCSEEKYRELVENLNDVIYIVDSNGTITYVSPPVESVLGYTRSDLVGKNYEDYVHPDDLDAMRQVFKDVLQNRIYPSDFRIRNKGGEYRWVRISSRPIHEENKAKGLQGVLTDIDEYKRADDALRESEENMRYILKHDPNAIAVYDSKLHYIAVSDRYLQDYNVKEKDIIGINHYEVFPEMPQKWKDVHQRCLAGAVERNDDDYFERPDGSITYNRWECRPWRRTDGEIGGIITYTEVTTERKKVEKELRESEEKFRNLFNNAGAGMFRTRIDGSEMLDMNQKFLDIFGRSREEMQGSPSKIHWADPSEREEMVRRFKLEDQVSNFECRMLNKQGDVRTCLTSLRLYREQEILEGSIIDITERKQAEEELRESQQLMEGIINAIPVRVFWKDKNLVYLGCNALFAHDAGFADPKDIIGKDDYQMVWRDQAELYRGDDLQVIETGEANLLSEEPSTTPEGKTITVLTSKIPLCSSTGEINGVLGTYMDITDFKLAEKENQKLEAQLQQSQKMEAIGLLAGGIAHDFNNLLTTIIGYADFALEQVRENISLNSEITEIRKAGRKAAALTRQLLTFSRKQLIQPEILNLNDIFKDINKMLLRTIGEDIELLTMFEPELWDVEIDPGQIQQILLNLVVNARDAMPTGGKLTIETVNVELDDVYFQNYGVKDKRGSYVLLSVADSGIGMDEEILSRIFEPFFTTKERGQGTGLGLSTVYGIVKQNNGHIRADSEPGKGTTFKVYFQRIKTDEVSDDIEEQLDENQLKGSETILVVEDSETLLKLTQKMLESYGYKILAAQSGNEAMQILNGHDGTIHLLLTDVVMPDMNGRELAEKIQSESPKVQVLYMSGYTDDTISKHGVLYDDVEFIEKPFSTKDLGLKVREVLNQGIDDL